MEKQKKDKLKTSITHNARSLLQNLPLLKIQECLRMSIPFMFTISSPRFPGFVSISP
jgi:hypothetical protein